MAFLYDIEVKHKMSAYMISYWSIQSLPVAHQLGIQATAAHMTHTTVTGLQLNATSCSSAALLRSTLPVWGLAELKTACCSSSALLSHSQMLTCLFLVLHVPHYPFHTPLHSGSMLVQQCGRFIPGFQDCNKHPFPWGVQVSNDEAWGNAHQLQ